MGCPISDNAFHTRGLSRSGFSSNIYVLKFGSESVRLNVRHKIGLGTYYRHVNFRTLSDQISSIQKSENVIYVVLNCKGDI